MGSFRRPHQEVGDEITKMFCHANCDASLLKFERSSSTSHASLSLSLSLSLSYIRGEARMRSDMPVTCDRRVWKEFGSPEWTLHELFPVSPPQQMYPVDPPRQLLSVNPPQQINTVDPPRQLFTISPPKQIYPVDPPQKYIR